MHTSTQILVSTRPVLLALVKGGPPGPTGPPGPVGPPGPGVDLLTTKGDLLTHNDVEAVRLPVGTDGTFFKANSIAANGVEWDAVDAEDLPVAIPGASIDAGDVPVEGVATTLVRSDHQHGVSTGSAVGIDADTPNAEGTSTDLARADHTHDIPPYLELAGGTMAGAIDMGGQDITAAGGLDAETVRSGRLTFAVTTNTAALGDADVYACTDTTAARTLTISTSTIQQGTQTRPRVITITDDSGGAGTNNITIDTEGAQTIDGAASTAITVGFGTVVLLSDGSNLTSTGGGSGKTNAFDRAPLTVDPLVTVDVYSVDDLPDAIVAPDGVSRVPLGDGVQYIVHKSFVWPRLMLPIGESLIEATEIVGSRFLAINMLVSGSEIPHIWGRNISVSILKNITVVDSSNAGAGRGTVLFDVTGGLDTATLTFDAVVFFSFLRMGNTLDVINVVQSPSAYLDVSGGMVTEFTGTFNSPGTPVIAPIFGVVRAALKPMWSYIGTTNTVINMSSGSMTMNPGDAGLYVDPAFTGSLSLVGMGYAGSSEGDFFRSDVSLGITGEAGADKSISSFSADNRSVSSVIPSVSGVTFIVGVRHNWRVGDTVTHTGFSTVGYNGVITITSLTPFTYSATAVAFVIDDSGTATHDASTLVTSAGHGLYRGQTVLLGGATPGAYTGLMFILAVEDDEDGFTIPVAFSVGGTGTIQITRVTTASDHPMVKGETHTIAGTAAYNGTRAILGLPADDQFDISAPFATNEGAVGTVSSSSLDETDLNLNSVGNGAQKDSKSIGSVVADGNAVSTIITMVNTWTDLDLGAIAAAGSNIERWGSVNSTTGEVTYLGIAEFSGELRASVSVTSQGSSQGFQFRAVVNGAPLSDGVVVSVDLSNAPMISVTLLAPIQCSTGDVVRVQVQNTSGTSNVFVQDLSMIIS